MPFTKGNTIGAATRFKTGQSGNPAGRPPDRLRKRIEAELEKIASSEPGEARTKLDLLAENIVGSAPSVPVRVRSGASGLKTSKRSATQSYTLQLIRTSRADSRESYDPGAGLRAS